MSEMLLFGFELDDEMLQLKSSLEDLKNGRVSKFVVSDDEDDDDYDWDDDEEDEE